MTFTLATSTLSAFHKSPKQAAQDAEKYAREVYAFSQKLLPLSQPVFRAWLKAQSRGFVQEASQAEIQRWLVSMPPCLAQSEYLVLLTEISWLETLAEYFCSPSGKEQIT